MAARNSMRSNITENTLPLTSDNVYSEIQRDLLRPVFISSLMASDTFLRDWALNGEVDASLITKFLHEIKVEYSTISSFFVSDSSHHYYHAHGILKTVQEDEPRDAWYFNARDLKAPYEINVDLDMANQDQMTIFINYRVFDYDDNFIGITGVGLTVNNVNHLISRYEAKYDRQIYFLNTARRDRAQTVQQPVASNTRASHEHSRAQTARQLNSWHKNAPQPPMSATAPLTCSIAALSQSSIGS